MPAGPLAAAAGADHIITYTQQDVAAEVHKVVPHGVDIIVEVAAAANAGIDAAVIGRTARCRSTPTTGSRISRSRSGR